LCDFLLVINSDFGPISHRLAIIHSLQTTDRQTDDNGAKYAVQFSCSASKKHEFGCSILVCFHTVLHDHDVDK